MSPDVDQSCVFPSEDGYGEHNACRRIVDWEETGIEHSKYRVNMHNFKQRKKILVQFVCSTEVDDVGLAKFHSWGWCGEGCPLGNDTTWGTDETLTVTTHTVMGFDEDIYYMIFLLGCLAVSLLLITRALKCHGNVKEKTYFFN